MNEKLKRLMTEAEARKLGLTVRVTRPEPQKHAFEVFGPVLADFRASLRMAAVVALKRGMAEVWAEKAPKLGIVTCLEFSDLGCGPPSQWARNGRPRPLREV